MQRWFTHSEKNKRHYRPHATGFPYLTRRVHNKIFLSLNQRQDSFRSNLSKGVSEKVFDNRDFGIVSGNNHSGDVAESGIAGSHNAAFPGNNHLVSLVVHPENDWLDHASSRSRPSILPALGHPFSFGAGRGQQEVHSGWFRIVCLFQK